MTLTKPPDMERVEKRARLDAPCESDANCALFMLLTTESGANAFCNYKLMWLDLTRTSKAFRKLIEAKGLLEPFHNAVRTFHYINSSARKFSFYRRSCSEFDSFEGFRFIFHQTHVTHWTPVQNLWKHTEYHEMLKYDLGEQCHELWGKDIYLNLSYPLKFRIMVIDICMRSGCLRLSIINKRWDGKRTEERHDAKYIEEIDIFALPSNYWNQSIPWYNPSQKLTLPVYSECVTFLGREWRSVKHLLVAIRSGKLFDLCCVDDLTFFKPCEPWAN